MPWISLRVEVGPYISWVGISTMAKEEVGKDRKAEGRDRGRVGCN